MGLQFPSFQTRATRKPLRRLLFVMEESMQTTSHFQSLVNLTLIGKATSGCLLLHRQQPSQRSPMPIDISATVVPWLYQVTHPWHWLTYGQNAAGLQALCAFLALIGLIFYTLYTRRMMMLGELTRRAAIT